jgi:hypothetical protein
MSTGPDESAKSYPAGAPVSPAQLAQTLKQAVDDPETRAPISVRLDVEGGQREDRYEFHFAAAGSGEAEVALLCNLRGRVFEPRRAELEEEELAGLLKAIDARSLAEASKARARIPPDSLVGRLRVSDGRQEMIVFFMADPEQARTAGYEPPAAIARVVDQIYALGAKALETEDVRP